MLTAHNKAAEVVYSWNATKGEMYFCPECSSLLVFKSGMLKIPHFAHKNVGDCPITSESAAHLFMKKHLYDSIKKRYPAAKVELEKKLIDDRRADVVMHGKEKSLVIECQVSPMTIEQLRERTLDYSKAGYHVLWIFHISRFKVPEKRMTKEGKTKYVQVKARSFEQIDRKTFMKPADMSYLESLESLYVMDETGLIKPISFKVMWGREVKSWLNIHHLKNQLNFRLEDMIDEYDQEVKIGRIFNGYNPLRLKQFQFIFHNLEITNFSKDGIADHYNYSAKNDIKERIIKAFALKNIVLNKKDILIDDITITHTEKGERVKSLSLFGDGYDDEYTHYCSVTVFIRTKKYGTRLKGWIEV